ncbi:hypothetical protein LCGC14_2018370 [marine sediment metagenome]|uniref:Uncharacterized protein n=1 Tax=marine sediment metagenome TaxID=412755 RepID=A0A0F9HBL5_9ZZZZ
MLDSVHIVTREDCESSTLLAVFRSQADAQSYCQFLVVGGCVDLEDLEVTEHDLETSRKPPHGCTLWKVRRSSRDRQLVIETEPAQGLSPGTVPGGLVGAVRDGGAPWQRGPCRHAFVWAPDAETARRRVQEKHPEFRLS